jgi:hypothetical protein
MEFFSSVFVAVFSRHGYIRTLSFLALLFTCSQAGTVLAAKIPPACSDQSPWGAPAWKGKEPPLTRPREVAFLILRIVAPHGSASGGSAP